MTSLSTDSGGAVGNGLSVYTFMHALLNHCVFDRTLICTSPSDCRNTRQVYTRNLVLRIPVQLGVRSCSPSHNDAFHEHVRTGTCHQLRRRAKGSPQDSRPHSFSTQPCCANHGAFRVTAPPNVEASRYALCGSTCRIFNVRFHACRI